VGVYPSLVREPWVDDLTEKYEFRRCSKCIHDCVWSAKGANMWVEGIAFIAFYLIDALLETYANRSIQLHDYCRERCNAVVPGWHRLALN
jgi:hypothetical protein